ncbi:diacylglycerol/lipid kinase family protein [Lacibacter sp.]|jgi:diacylglycerol kinase (ATP)|uniref:diacylglycerol/lipid kinase family protein n=1 Tax=Lacibacter sp. TaxID=1915409 RepID=UPI002B4B36C4|nr:YegS/Rv2252/BmrU family lipid kinase [Lacibacter sp.]HLP37903.1 YegS/Rv2252/BmrU family lipid kinase [Lacibacter sp.]
MQRRFIFLFNPRSGVQKGKSLAEIITERCQRAAVQFSIEHSRADGDYSSLKEKIINEAVTDVVIAGGDGTISTIVASIKDLPVNIGIIPRGSGNGLALAAGISKDVNKAIDIIFNGNANRVDAFLINDHFSCMLSGIGFDAQVAHEFDREKKRGLKKYIQLTLKNLQRIKTYRFVIKAKETDLQLRAYFISIANSNQFGNQFTIAPKASLQDGLLDIVAVEKTNIFFVLMRILWHIRFGKFTGDFTKRRGITYFQTAELTITNIDNAPLHIDGDGKPTAASFYVKVLPAAYSLLVP